MGAGEDLFARPAQWSSARGWGPRDGETPRVRRGRCRPAPQTGRETREAGREGDTPRGGHGTPSAEYEVQPFPLPRISHRWMGSSRGLCKRLAKMPA